MRAITVMIHLADDSRLEALALRDSAIRLGTYR